MGAINWTRVLLGGLVAVVVINVVEFVLSGVVLSKDWATAMAALGTPPMSPGQIAVLAFWSFVIWVFFVGVFSVWLCAAIRPRSDAGLNTALGAGFVVWSLRYGLGSSGPARDEYFPASAHLHRPGGRLSRSFGGDTTWRVAIQGATSRLETVRPDGLGR